MSIMSSSASIILLTHALVLMFLLTPNQVDSRLVKPTSELYFNEPGGYTGKFCLTKSRNVNLTQIDQLAIRDKITDKILFRCSPTKSFNCSQSSNAYSCKLPCNLNSNRKLLTCYRNCVDCSGYVCEELLIYNQSKPTFQSFTIAGSYKEILRNIYLHNDTLKIQSFDSLSSILPENIVIKFNYSMECSSIVVMNKTIFCQLKIDTQSQFSIQNTGVTLSYGHSNCTVQKYLGEILIKVNVDMAFLTQTCRRNKLEYLWLLLLFVGPVSLIGLVYFVVMRKHGFNKIKVHVMRSSK